MIQKLVDKLFTPEQKKRIHAWLLPKVAWLEDKRAEKEFNLTMLLPWLYRK